MKNVIIGVILGMIVIIFAWQNAETVTVELFFWQLTTSRAVMLIIVFVIGFFTGWIIRSIRAHKKLKKVESEIKQS
jgi:putative membrane protein